LNVSMKNLVENSMRRNI